MGPLWEATRSDAPLALTTPRVRTLELAEAGPRLAGGRSSLLRSAGALASVEVLPCVREPARWVAAFTGTAMEPEPLEPGRLEPLPQEPLGDEASETLPELLPPRSAASTSRDTEAGGSEREIISVLPLITGDTGARDDDTRGERGALRAALLRDAALSPAA